MANILTVEDAKDVQLILQEVLEKDHDYSSIKLRRNLLSNALPPW